MACYQHDWYFDTECPTCAAATVTVTAAAAPPDQEVREPTSPAATDALPPPDGQVVQDGNEVASVAPAGPDMPPIPDFLLRNADNTLKFPERWGSIQEIVWAEPPAPEDVKVWSDDRLWEAVNGTMSVSDRQPVIQEITRRQNRRRTYERLDKAGFTRAQETNGITE